MAFKQVHTFKDHVDLHYGDQLLFRYVYMPATDPFEANKPYFHPLCTLSGDVVTIFRPHDHRWHHGLAMTCANLSGENFWGGNSYVHGEGYVPLPKVGRQEHREWEEMVISEDAVMLLESLTWITQGGEAWIDELREIRVSEVNQDKGYWSLDVDIELRNIHHEPLVFGSPTTQGRPKAGYGGLFWRGPRDFTGGKIMIAGGHEAVGDEDPIIGTPGQWLAFVGQHDAVDRSSTLLFIDQPGNPRYPNKWFTRTKPFAAASFAFMYDEEFTLDTGRELELRYRMVIASGAWTREQIEGYLEMA